MSSSSSPSSSQAGGGGEGDGRGTGRRRRVRRRLQQLQRGSSSSAALPHDTHASPASSSSSSSAATTSSRRRASSSSTAPTAAAAAAVSSTSTEGVWPAPFVESLAHQVALDASVSTGRLAAGPAIAVLFQVKYKTTLRQLLKKPMLRHQSARNHCQNSAYGSLPVGHEGRLTKVLYLLLEKFEDEGWDCLSLLWSLHPLVHLPLLEHHKIDHRALIPPQL
ncbi:hypothetical protein Dimus_019637 [Dionaea muscipula]